MKMRLLVLALGLLALAGCDFLRDDDCLIQLEQYDDPHWGEMSALRNDEPWPVSPWPVSPWHGSLYAISDKEQETMDILMNVFNQNGFHRELLAFHGIPKQAGIYQLPGQIVERMEEQLWFFFTSEDDGDVGADSYIIDKKKMDNFLTIDSYDTPTCTIEGTFSLTVVRDTTSTKVFPYSDTLRFTQGRFRTHVVTYP